MSVEAVQERLTCVAEAALAVRFVGAVGDVVSGEAEVLVVEITERVLRLLAASVARTR